MSRVTDRAIESFYNGVSAHPGGNTYVHKIQWKDYVGMPQEGVGLYLYNSMIARRNAAGRVEITDADRPSRLTRMRLSLLDGVNVFSSDGILMLSTPLDGEREWDGSWTVVR